MGANHYCNQLRQIKMSKVIKRIWFSIAFISVVIFDCLCEIWTGKLDGEDWIFWK